MEKELMKKKNTININTVVNYIIILLKMTKTSRQYACEQYRNLSEEEKDKCQHCC